jgi:hypothetical protein
MFDWIVENTRTVEGIVNLSKENMYYAWKYLEEDKIEMSSEVISELAFQMCLCGM